MSAPRNHITIGEMLTERQIADAVQLYQRYGRSPDFIDAVIAEVVHPNIKEIERKCERMMLERYVAYMIEFALIEHGE